MTDDLITTSDAAEMSGYHVEYLRKLLQDGKIGGRKFGPVWQVSKKSLRDYLKRAKQAGDKRHGPK